MEKQQEKLYIGIDMGGTNTEFGIVNAKGNILYSDKISTNSAKTANEFADSLCEALLKLVKKVGLEGQITGIGIGAPNGNFINGHIENAANIPWAKNGAVPLAKMITDRTGLPCKLTNDANAAAVGEQIYGVARGMKHFIVITLGTGIGSGIVINGELVVGHDGMAGELGHAIVMRENGRSCGCGRSGCLETYCSATGVARTAREMLETQPDRPSELRKLDYSAITSKDVFEAAKNGDQLAIDIFNFTGNILGEAFANFITFSSPEAIILFGGLAHAGDLITNPIKEGLDKNILSIFKGKTKILLSELSDAEAAILGASALAWE